MIMAPIMWGIQDYMMQRQRILENDHPDSNYGKLYGYVREGHKWFPAYITRSERDQGKLFGSDTTQIRMSYGTDLKFKHQKGTGNIIPYFDEGTYRQKDFHVWDDETDITNNSSGKDWRDQADPLRDFYFLSEEETHEFFHNLVGADTASQYLNDRDHEFTKEEQDAIRASQTSAFGMMQVYDDPTWGETWEKHGTDEQKEYYAKYGAYVGTVQDIRSGLELWHDYLTSEPGNIYTTRQDENQYSGAKGFRRAMNESGYPGYEGDKKGQGRRPEGATLQEMQDDAIAKNSSPASGANLTNAEMQGTQEGLWLVKEYAKSRDILIESQKRAGLKMHFDKIYKVPQNAPNTSSLRENTRWVPSPGACTPTVPGRLVT